MGAADVVPGVSGGTIAFISGIYESLLTSIRNIDFSLLGLWRKEGFAAVWRRVNGGFLLTLFAGIGFSLFTLSKGIRFLLEHHAHLLWAFFFGLVVASVWLVGKQVRQWSVGTAAGLLVGAAVAFFITTLAPSTPNEGPLYLFGCGMIAVCAMILPGISGSFILLLLGAYGTFVGALADRNFLLLGSLVAGAGIGLVLFSRLLTWLFKRAHDLVVAVLAGFLIGSLNKLWPWKQVDTFYVKHAGEADESWTALQEHAVSPSAFTECSELGTLIRENTYAAAGCLPKDPQVELAVVCALAGLALIIGLEWAARKLGKQEA